MFTTMTYQLVYCVMTKIIHDKAVEVKYFSRSPPGFLLIYVNVEKEGAVSSVMRRDDVIT